MPSQKLIIPQQQKVLTTHSKDIATALANEIANAKDSATVKISRDKNINALPNDIMQALYKKQTVALELEYTFEGNEYTVTIPAGKAEDNAIEWYGPLYLQMRYGK